MFYSEHSIFAQMNEEKSINMLLQNVYLCSLWVKFRKSCMHHFIVSYNNAFRILHGLPMRCSAGGMIASSGVNSCQTLYQEKRIQLTMQITCFAEFNCA